MRPAPCASSVLSLLGLPRAAILFRSSSLGMTRNGHNGSNSSHAASALSLRRLRRCYVGDDDINILNGLELLLPNPVFTFTFRPQEVVDQKLVNATRLCKRAQFKY
jgi:hypothetical protein